MSIHVTLLTLFVSPLRFSVGTLPLFEKKRSMTVLSKVSAQFFLNPFGLPAMEFWSFKVVSTFTALSLVCNDMGLPSSPKTRKATAVEACTLRPDLDHTFALSLATSAAAVSVASFGSDTVLDSVDDAILAEGDPVLEPARLMEVEVESEAAISAVAPSSPLPPPRSAIGPV